MSKFNRRQFFRIRLTDVSREFAKAVSQSGKDENDEAEPFLRPPGALEDEDEFLSTCDRCQACADACPFGVIYHFGPIAGQLEKTPFVDPEKIPCRWCEDMPCINACPSGALRFGENGKAPPLAKVSLDLDKCLNNQGILCDTCTWNCPSHIKAIRMVGRQPKLDEDLCVGCGMCVFHCEAQPSAFRFSIEA